MASLPCLLHKPSLRNQFPKSNYKSNTVWLCLNSVFPRKMATSIPIQNLLPISSRKPIQFSALNPTHMRLCLKPAISSSFSSLKCTSKKVGFLFTAHCNHSPRTGGDNLPMDVGDEWNTRQLFELLSSIMGFVGPRIELVIKPTMLNGLDIGINWSLVWKKTHTPVGQGLSFYMLHKYEGKMLIGNVGMKIKPLAHIETLILNMMRFLMPIFDQISLCKNMDVKGRFAVILHYLVIMLLITAISLCLWKKFSH